MKTYTATISTPLGALWLCATEEGLCGVEFGGPSEGLRGALARYGLAVPLREEEHPFLARARTQIDAYFEGRVRTFDLPLELQGTHFQRAVWQTLLRIPYGETRAYGEVAAVLGRPRGARAVGQAVGANPVSILVPCHRVVGSDGQLTGYGGGLERKMALLELEQDAVQLRMEGPGTSTPEEPV
ncbi:MAG: methylated-DNA--[protein]-cysteine S-methyltransferase [Anaerolineales bacterium]